MGHRWTQEELGRLKADLTAFFGAYYSELLRLVEERGPDVLPDWVKGRRLVHVYACSDGVIVGHVYPERAPEHAKVERDADGNLFWFQLDPARPVKEAIAVFAPPPRLGGLPWPQWRPPDYPDGQPFGSHVVTTPLEAYVRLEDERYSKEEAGVWSRLEWSDIERLASYRDPSLARREARDLIDRLAGGARR